MGGGFYDSSTRSSRARSSGYYTKSSAEIFNQRTINDAMSPFGITHRESRDSEEHPDSLAIMLALDLTGSMGSIPAYLVKDGLPNIMDKIIQGGVKHPQLLFTGVGDHECDSYPLQVGQFESSDKLLDTWLTKIYLEAGGGGNDGESYLLAWYFAAYHTLTDCFQKRNKKGYLFTIGDEPTLKNIHASDLRTLMGEGQYSNISAIDLLSKASETYNVYHIHVKETRAGQMRSTIDGWKQLMAGNLLIVDRHEEVSNVIADTIIKNEKNNSNISIVINNSSNETPNTDKCEAVFL